MIQFLVSSTNALDINSLRVALLAYIKAKQDNTTFILRVNDIKQSKEPIDQFSIDILKKFAIDTNNTYYQSKNLSIYQHLAKNLVQNSKAYACFCNNNTNKCNCKEISKEKRDNLIKDKKSFSIYLKEPKENFTINDTLQKELTFSPNTIGSIKILDSNANPSNIFALAVDNISSNITTIIDNKSNLLSNAKALYIQKQLNYNNNITLIHLPDIEFNEAITIKQLLQDGYLPDAIINYLLSLTLNYKNRDIFYLPDAILTTDFNNLDINHVPKFNFDELKEFNRSHLLRYKPKKLSTIFGFADDNIGLLLQLFLKDATTINELETHFKAVFCKKDCNQIQKELSKQIMQAPYFVEYKHFKEYLLEKTNLNENELEKHLSLLLVGKNNIENLDTIYKYLKSYILEVAQCQ